MNAKDIVGSVMIAAFTLMILAAVVPLAAPGPFSQVLKAIQTVDDFIIGAIVITAPVVGYSILREGW